MAQQGLDGRDIEDLNDLVDAMEACLERAAVADPETAAAIHRLLRIGVNRCWCVLGAPAPGEGVRAHLSTVRSLPVETRVVAA